MRGTELLLFLAAIAVAGCGDSNAGNDTADVAATDASDTEPADALDDTDIAAADTGGAGDASTDNDVVDDVADAFADDVADVMRDDDTDATPAHRRAVLFVSASGGQVRGPTLRGVVGFGAPQPSGTAASPSHSVVAGPLGARP